MTLALKNADFAAPHRLAEPSYIIHGDSCVFRAVVDDYFTVDVDISEADCLTAFETNQQIDGGVGVGGG